MENTIPSINSEIDFLDKNHQEVYCVSDWVQIPIEGKMTPVRITAIHHDDIIVRTSSYNNNHTLGVDKILENLYAILSKSKDNYSTKSALCVQYAAILIEIDNAIVRLNIDKNIFKKSKIVIKGKWHIDYKKWAELLEEAGQNWGYKDFKKTDDVCYFYPGFEYKLFVLKHELFWEALHDKLGALVRILKEIATYVNGEQIKDKKTTTNDDKPIKEEPLLYVSYSWSVFSLIDDLCLELEKNRIAFSRDVNDCGYRDNIKQFEEKIGKGARVLAFINDEYLKSINCMYELALVFMQGNVENRLFPIVTIDNGRNATVLKDLHGYWDLEYQKKKMILNDLPSGASLQAIQELGYCDHIIRELPKIVNYISEVNTLSLEELSANNFKVLINKLHS